MITEPPRPGEPPATAANHVGGARVLRDRVVVAGEIDLSNALQLRLALEKAARRVDRDLEVDLTEVGFFGSAAMSVLWQYAETHRLRLIVRAGSAVERVVRITGLDRVTGLVVQDSSQPTG